MSDLIDFISSVVISVGNPTPCQNKLAHVLIEEIEKRSWRSLALKCGMAAHDWKASKEPAIALGTRKMHSDYPDEILALLKDKPLEPEGFCIVSASLPRPVIVVHGADDRGLLYGIGRLLRMARINLKKFLLPAVLDISGSPRYAMRGHMLAYRPMNNTSDAWDEKRFDQYIRDMALFGANSIELIVPHTEDNPTGPLIRKDPLEMLIAVTDIIDSYGLDVWIYYPNVMENYNDEETLRKELAEREDVFSKLKRIDGVLVAGGDPGNLTPDETFAWSEKVAALLHKYHPKAGLWISPQVFAPSADWFTRFFENVKREPEWLAGIVHAPWSKMTPPEMRKLVPAKYPLRNYPDITHCFSCQYPVYDWDPALAKTLARECINPRPIEQKRIHNLYADSFVGSICYSEGINDDVNKFIWTDQEWNPDTPVIDTLRDYARFFIDSARADDLAQGILALERNFANPVALNKEIFICLRQWQELEKALPFAALENYRFQMCLLRAHYDAYIKRRLAWETELELKAMEILVNTTPEKLCLDAHRAIEILDRARTEPVGLTLREKCTALADMLYINIGEQLTVKRHFARDWGRGAFMDSIDAPLNDSRYIIGKLEKILVLGCRDEAFVILEKEILDRTNPGPGGFYDSMGDIESWKRLPDPREWKKDPGVIGIAFRHFIYALNETRDDPLAWQKSAGVLYDTPMKIQYDDLDPDTEYSLKIKFIGIDSSSLVETVRMSINDEKFSFDVPQTNQKNPLVCFDLPKRITQEGTVIIILVRPYGGSTTAVAEIFLVKRKKI